MVGYDETRWQVRYSDIVDECFWIPKESFFAFDSPKEMEKKKDSMTKPQVLRKIEIRFTNWDSIVYPHVYDSGLNNLALSIYYEKYHLGIPLCNILEIKTEWEE